MSAAFYFRVKPGHCQTCPNFLSDLQSIETPNSPENVTPQAILLTPETGNAKTTQAAKVSVWYMQVSRGPSTVVNNLLSVYSESWKKASRKKY